MVYNLSIDVVKPNTTPCDEMIKCRNSIGKSKGFIHPCSQDSCFPMLTVARESKKGSDDVGHGSELR